MEYILNFRTPRVKTAIRSIKLDLIRSLARALELLSDLVYGKVAVEDYTWSSESELKLRILVS